MIFSENRFPPIGSKPVDRSFSDHAPMAEHDLFGKPASTFPDHALMAERAAGKAAATVNGIAPCLLVSASIRPISGVGPTRTTTPAKPRVTPTPTQSASSVAAQHPDQERGTDLIRNCRPRRTWLTST